MGRRFEQSLMSKSVRSNNSSLSRKDKSSQRETQGSKIKERIKEILYSVKEERQHIENRLHENDVYIQQLRQDYEMQRYAHDFEHLNQEEETILRELSQGLAEMRINPQSVLGPQGRGDEEGEYREMSKQEIIAVQEMLMERLKQELGQASQ